MAATLVQQAITGKRSAMTTLYTKYKSEVFYLATLLLNDERLAAKATASVFQEIWAGARDAELRTEQDFRSLAVSLTISECRRTISRQNPRAYRLPQNRDFAIRADLVAPKGTACFEEYVLARFSDLQRLIFVLHNVVQCRDEDIGLTLKLDNKTLTLALEAERENIERLLTANKKENLSFDDIVEYFVQKQAEAIVPSDTDTAVAESIDRIAAPLEKNSKNRLLRKLAIVAAVCALVAGFLVLLVSVWNAAHGIGGSGNSSSGSTGTTTKPTTSTSSTADGADITEPVIDLDESLDYYANIDIADYGTITVKLEPEAAPITVSHFVNLAQEGFYNGLTFHRIIEGFMMQGGDPGGDGLSDDDQQTILGEFTSNGVKNDLKHTRGAISMARTSIPNSATSQFFIVHETSDHLDGDYAVFGYVTKGMDIVDAVCEDAEPTDNNGSIAADAQPVINTITITTATKSE